MKVLLTDDSGDRPREETSASMSDVPGVEQFGAICIRKDAMGGEEILLITTRETKRWTIPKGWAIKGLKPHQVAEREAWEEAGVLGRAGKRPVGSFRYMKKLNDGALVQASVEVHVLEVRRLKRRDATIEILNYKRDGTPFWNELHMSPLRNDAGEVAYLFASQLDVTELRRVQTLEEAEHRLLLEVDHRTKNVLAIVDSIVRLSKSENAAAYSASVQQRVQALSRTHMLLAEHGWQEVALGEIIRTQVAVFAQRSVDVAGPTIMIPAPSVQPIGLAIHELVTNAAVHGALSDGRGRLTIGWKPEGKGLVLDWSEQGVKFEPGGVGRGFGEVLLSAVIEKQLGGQITRDWKSDGLSLRIELPSLDRVGRDLRRKPRPIAFLKRMPAWLARSTSVKRYEPARGVSLQRTPRRSSRRTPEGRRACDL
jgi:two-component sensor histidine kinase